MTPPGSSPEVHPDTAPPVGPPGRISLRNLLEGAPVAPLAILFALNAVDELDRVAFGVLLPEIRDHFGLDNTGILGIVGVVGALSLLLQPFVGWWGDRVRRVPLALGGAATWAVFSFLTGIAPVLAVLVIARIGSSLGKLVNDPTHQSLLSDYYDPDRRVRAFYLHRIANNVGQLFGPIIAGGLALVFGWRAPFIVFAVPTAVVLVIGLGRLREPVRGHWERRAAGADEELAATEDEAVSFAEAWRAAHQVRTLRRIFYSLPWFGASLTGLGSLYALYYEDVFGLNELARGVLATVGELPQIAGAAAGAVLGTRLARRDPGLIMKLLAVAAIVISAGLLIVAAAPNIAVAVLGNMVASGAGAVITAGIFVSVSFVIPPRIRTMGFGVGSVYAAPGVIIVLPVVGAIADGAGVRWGIAAMVPVFLVGSFILASAGSMVAPDIARVRASALAQAELARSRQRGETKLLMVRGLDVHYGQTQVLFGVDLEVADGEIVALLGTNGAGKSTLLNAISGLVEATGGAIVFEGREITSMPPDQAVRRGIVLVPGGKGVFPTLTVGENLELAGWAFADDPAHVAAATAQVLEFFPILRERWDEKAGNLSGGEQQMLTLGQAFIAKPKLLMIDELSLGLAPVIVEQLLEIVRAIHAMGTTIILVEQSVNVACTIAERAVFMEKGEVRFDGPTVDLLDRPDVLRAVFLQGAAAATGDRSPSARPDGPGPDGSAGATPVIPRVSPTPRRRPTSSDRPAIETRDLAVSFGGIRAVDGVDLTLADGEILGLIGPNGAGKTTVMDLISGFLVPTAGRVIFNGVDVTDMSADQRAWMGLGRSFQDARLFPSLTVAETLAVALERHIPTRDPLAAALVSPATRMSEQWVRRRVDELIELMNLGAFANKFISELSTGTRRVVDIACSMAHEPSVLLLDEPSSGIAQRETEALGPVIRNIRDAGGTSIIVIEHDMPLIQSVSDRLVALETGRVIAEGTPAEVINHPRVVEAYLGGADEVIHRSGEAGARRRPRTASVAAAGAVPGGGGPNGPRPRRTAPVVAADVLPGGGGPDGPRRVGAPVAVHDPRAGGGGPNGPGGAPDPVGDRASGNGPRRRGTPLRWEGRP